MLLLLIMSFVVVTISISTVVAIITDTYGFVMMMMLIRMNLVFMMVMTMVVVMKISSPADAWGVCCKALRLEGLSTKAKVYTIVLLYYYTNILLYYCYYSRESYVDSDVGIRASGPRTFSGYYEAYISPKLTFRSPRILDK